MACGLRLTCFTVSIAEILATMFAISKARLSCFYSYLLATCPKSPVERGHVCCCDRLLQLSHFSYLTSPPDFRHLLALTLTFRGRLGLCFIFVSRVRWASSVSLVGSAQTRYVAIVCLPASLWSYCVWFHYCHSDSTSGMVQLTCYRRLRCSCITYCPEEKATK